MGGKVLPHISTSLRVPSCITLPERKKKLPRMIAIPDMRVGLLTYEVHFSTSRFCLIVTEFNLLFEARFASILLEFFTSDDDQDPAGSREKYVG